MSGALASVQQFVSRLQGDGSSASQRLRELMVALAIVFVTGYVGLSVSDKYPTVFIAVVGIGVMLLMIENQERTLHVLLWFSTVYALLKATVLGWSTLAFVFKEGFLVLLVAFWLFHFSLRQERFPETPINKPLLVLVGWILMQCFNPNNFGLLSVVDDVRQWLGQLAIFALTVYLINDERKVERGLAVVFGYSTIAMLYGIAQQFMPHELLIKLGADPRSYFYFYENTVRSFSTMGTAPFAMFASIFPCIAFFYAAQQNSPFHRFLFNGLGFGFIAAVLLTLVRTSWVATVVSVLLYAVLARRYGLIAVLLVMVLVVGMFASGYMREKVQGLLNPSEDRSIQTRLLIASLISEAIVFRAFGYGMGTFAHSKWGVEEAGRVGYGTQTENWYIMVSLELGWIGMLMLGWLWYKIYRIAWLNYKGGLQTRRYRDLSLAIAGALFTIEVSRLGGPAGYFPPDSWHYWFLVGILMVLPRADRERAEREAGAKVAVTASDLALSARSSAVRTA